MVVDPWGKVLLDLQSRSSEPELGIVNIDLEYQEKVKNQMPLLRRT